MTLRFVFLAIFNAAAVTTAFDRNLASRMGSAAVKFLLSGRSDVMVGEVNQEIVAVPLKDTFTKKKAVRKDWITLEKTLSI